MGGARLFNQLQSQSVVITSYSRHYIANRSSLITCELIPSTCASLNGNLVRETCCFYPCHSAAFHQVLGFCLL